ncbi:ANTAR domain-containing response regulator [Bilifractor sp. LCP19S3_H10]|uniref:ANTAR domain-containing response regulator n=1 Tax=unclassified Bilifractor TaxID=2815795 RepID=UPI002A8AD2CB|nr:response regulator [Eubacterium sp.]MDY5113001.1 response regulator [Bilifractor sp.]
MRSIIVAYSKLEDAKKIRAILVRHGLNVNGVCTTVDRAISLAGTLYGGVVICGYRLADGIYLDLAEGIPDSFQILLVTSPRNVDDEVLPANTVYLPTPLKVHELLQTLSPMLGEVPQRRKKDKPVPRNEEDQKKIDQAKEILMARNHMTEPEAHRYLQKCAMDSGTKIVETAEMVILLASPG